MVENKIFRSDKPSEASFARQKLIHTIGDNPSPASVTPEQYRQFTTTKMHSRVKSLTWFLLITIPITAAIIVQPNPKSYTLANAVFFPQFLFIQL